jgi:hypothetical protein
MSITSALAHAPVLSLLLAAPGAVPLAAQAQDSEPDGASHEAPALPRVPRSEIGMNLAGFEYSGRFGSSELPFADLMKSCKPFDAVLAGDNYPVGSSVRPYGEVFTSIDSNGYPLEAIPKNGYVLGTQIASTIDGHYAGGVYAVCFDGTATLAFGGDVAAVQQLSPQHYIITVVPANRGILLRVISSPGGAQHVRNLRVVHSQLSDLNGDPLQRFQPQFLERLAGLSPKALRFVNWKGVSSLTRTRLDEEADEGHYTYQRNNGGAGVPHSVLMDLCAEVGADLWVNIPYNAEFAEYVEPLAALLAAWSAQTGLGVRVEYGNEVWNPLFRAQYCYAIDEIMGCADCTPTSTPPLTNAIMVCQAQFLAARSDAIFDRFEAQFDALGIGQRLVRVLSGRINRSDYTLQILNNIGGPDQFDVLALNSFFGAQLVQQQGWQWALAASDQEILEYLRGRIEGPASANLLGFFIAHQNVLDLYNATLAETVVLNAYEGGQSLTFDACLCPNFCTPAGNPACPVQIDIISRKFNDLNRTPAMRELYWLLLGHWQAVTGDGGPGELWMAFSFIREYGTAGRGSWGVLEYLDSPVSEAYKYQALREAQSP